MSQSKLTISKKKIIDQGKIWLLVVLINFLFGAAFAAAAGQNTSVSSDSKKDPVVLKGKQLYADLRCFYCHSLKGQGGTIGPALDNVGFRRTQEWMAHHFREPSQVTHNSRMAKIKLKQSQVLALVAYMNSLGGYTYTPQAAGLYKLHCAACHRLNGGGMDANDLSQEGRYRDIYFLMDYIKEPSWVSSQTTMKSFKGVLTESQIKDIATYLYQQSR